MPEENNSRGYAVRALSDRVEVTVTGPWTAEAARLFESGEADDLVLNYALGFNEPELTFLEGLPVRHLQVLDRRLGSLEPIESLGSTLESLSVVSHPSLQIDLAAFPRLSDLSADWEQVSGSIGSVPQLAELFLLRYRPPSLQPLAHMSGLRRLVMKDRPSLKSLDGLEQLRLLETFHVPGARYLTDTTALRGRRDLVDLSLEACTKLSSLDDLSQCAGLRHLDISECGNVASLEPLRGLDSLEVLQAYGTTRILDGDLSPIAELPRLKELRMQNRKHYRPSVPEVKASFA